MISSLTSPSVCVIDEDPNEYGPILEALNSLYISCVHIKGDNVDQLPPQPFSGLRLVFTDLHLTGATGKNTASHTANVFCRVVSATTAPVVVVIWSKYADDPVDSGLPPDDQETESEIFRRTLLETTPAYAGRLVFVEMKKPKPGEQDPHTWVEAIKVQIRETMAGKEAVQALWTWESLAKDAVLSVSAGLTSLSQTPPAKPEDTLEQIKDALLLLTHAQSEGDTLSAHAAPHYLAVVLAQLLMDHLEHADGMSKLQQHGEWLATSTVTPARASQLAPAVNCFLLTTDVPTVPVPLMPGMVYMACDDIEFQKLFGVGRDVLVTSLFKDAKKGTGVTIDEWKKDARIVLVELSPGCDVDNGNRYTAILMAGLILPSRAEPNAKKDDSFKLLPTFMLRKEMEDFAKQAAFLIFCSRYKATLPATGVPGWLKPWFRLRELPTASLRNWHAGNASRVGYVSM